MRELRKMETQVAVAFFAIAAVVGLIYGVVKLVAWAV